MKPFCGSTIFKSCLHRFEKVTFAVHISRLLSLREYGIEFCSTARRPYGHLEFQKFFMNLAD